MASVRAVLLDQDSLRRWLRAVSWSEHPSTAATDLRVLTPSTDMDVVSIRTRLLVQTELTLSRLRRQLYA